MSHRLSGLRAALGAVVVAPFVALAAPPAHPDIFNAAICKPLFTSDLMSAIYDTVKAADPKPDESMLGAAVFRLPEPIRRDGFTTQNVVFTSTGIGGSWKVKSPTSSRNATSSPPRRATCWARRPSAIPAG